MSSLEKISARDAAEDGWHCSFCGNSPADDSALIAAAAADVFICGECIAAGSEMLTGDGATEDEPSATDEGEGDRNGHAGAPLKRTFFRLLTEEDITRLLSMDELIDAMQEALRRFSAGDVVQPVR